MARHCEAMVGFQRAGAEVFDYGNNLRGEARAAGFGDAFAYPGFVPAYIRPLFCQGKGPFRWAALSGDPADIARTDRAVLELFGDDEHLRRWLELAAERVRFQGLPARICWLGYGERHQAGLAFNQLVARGEVAAPIVIGRDHLDAGSVASPYRETEAMADGSDAIADWPILNALLNTASGASWVSVHHGGGVGIGRSIHAGVVVVADGTERGRPAGRAGPHQRPRHRGHAPRRRRLRPGPRGRGRAGHGPSRGHHVRVDFLLTGAGQLVTCDPGLGEGPLGLVERGRGRRRRGAGRVRRARGGPARAWRWTAGAVRLDAGGRAVLPGFVDAHTHLVFAGERADEFAARLRGVGYEEALAAGGGINRTVRETRAASDAELEATAADQARHRAPARHHHPGGQVGLRPHRRRRAPQPGGAGPAGRAVPGGGGPDLPRRPPDPRGVRRRPGRLPGPAGARDAAGVRPPGRVRGRVLRPGGPHRGGVPAGAGGRRPPRPQGQAPRQRARLDRRGGPGRRARLRLRRPPAVLRRRRRPRRWPPPGRWRCCCPAPASCSAPAGPPRPRCCGTPG